MEWLRKSGSPRRQWPRPVFTSQRAIAAEEHAAVVAREVKPERRDFCELPRHTGASAADAACLTAEAVDWHSRTIAYARMNLKSRGTTIQPAPAPVDFRGADAGQGCGNGELAVVGSAPGR